MIHESQCFNASRKISEFHPINIPFTKVPLIACLGGEMKYAIDYLLIVLYKLI